MKSRLKNRIFFFLSNEPDKRPHLQSSTARMKERKSLRAAPALTFFEAKEEKKVNEKPYQLDITYEQGKTIEKLSIKYSLRDYPFEREKALQDFTGILDKKLNIAPSSTMGGILGYAYLGENFMVRRDDVHGDKALMVDVHEAIHTHDEYETRVLTSWMLARERARDKK